MRVFENTLAIVLSAAAVLWTLAAAAATPAENLFYIARSTNANIVRYDVRRKPDGRLDLHNPVDAYWLMNAQNGHREELTFLERHFAYGFSATGVNPSGFSLRLTAFKQREVHVELHNGRYRPRVFIASVQATLHRIYVKTDGGGALPHVQYVELRGTTDSGTEVVERINAP